MGDLARNLKAHVQLTSAPKENYFWEDQKELDYNLWIHYEREQLQKESYLKVVNLLISETQDEWKQLQHSSVLHSFE